MSVSALSPFTGGPGWSNRLLVSTSGLRDATMRMDAVAHNVANSNTDAFVPDRIHSSALSSGGVTSEVVSTMDALTYGDLQRVYQAQGMPVPSQTDYVSEGVNLLLAKHAFHANARALQTSSETSKTLIDMLG